MQNTPTPPIVTNGTGDGGTRPPMGWTPADIIQIVLTGGLITIVLAILFAVIFVRQPEVRTILAALLGSGVGAISGVLTGSKISHGSNQGTQVDSANTVVIPDQSGGGNNGA